MKHRIETLYSIVESSLLFVYSTNFLANSRDQFTLFLLILKLIGK